MSNWPECEKNKNNKLKTEKKKKNTCRTSDYWKNLRKKKEIEPEVHVRRILGILKKSVNGVELRTGHKTRRVDFRLLAKARPVAF